MLRDIKERGRSLESVIDQYTTFVKPAFEEFTLPVQMLLLLELILPLSSIYRQRNMLMS